MTALCRKIGYQHPRILILGWVYVLLYFGHIFALSDRIQMGRIFKAVQTSLLVPRWFCHLCISFHPYSHSKTLSRHLKLEIPPKLSILLILIFYHFLFFSIHLDVGWNIWNRSLAPVSMLYPVTLSVAPQDRIEKLIRILYCFWFSIPLWWALIPYLVLY